MTFENIGTLNIEFFCLFIAGIFFSLMAVSEHNKTESPNEKWVLYGTGIIFIGTGFVFLQFTQLDGIIIFSWILFTALGFLVSLMGAYTWGTGYARTFLPINQEILIVSKVSLSMLHFRKRYFFEGTGKSKVGYKYFVPPNYYAIRKEQFPEGFVPTEGSVISTDENGKIIK